MRQALLRRRIMDNNVFELLYHWESVDGLVSGGWIDRVQGVGINQISGSPVLTDGLWKVSDSNYLSMDMNSASPQGLAMGSEWKVEVEAMFDTLSQDGFAMTLVDFGSVTNASHAFSFQLGIDGTFLQNAKLVGNNSASLYEATIPNAYTLGSVCKYTYGVEALDTNMNIPYSIYGGIKTYASTSLTPDQSAFNRNFYNNTLKVGAGVLTGYASNTFFYIKSIKIYKDKRERPKI